MLAVSGWLAVQPQPTAASPEFQVTGYPNPGDQPTQPSGYPQPGDQPTAVPTSTPTATLSAGQPTRAPTLPPQATLTATPAGSRTPGRDLFATENAEMGGARVTPPSGETPVSGLTQTPEPTSTPGPGLMNALQIDRRMFLAGLLIPLVLAMLGWVGWRIFRSGEFG